MPELKNEIPTDSELHNYFLEHFAFTITGEMDPGLNEMARAELAVTWAEWERIGGKKFINKIGGSVYTSLQRLNRLPRTEPFWHNTNRRPTVYKLPEFCDLVLKDDPGNVLALWTKLALSVLWGSQLFGPEQWRQLRTTDTLKAEDLIFAELYLELLNGEGDPPTTAKLLREFGLTETAKPLLKGCQRSEASQIAEWGESVLANLAG